MASPNRPIEAIERLTKVFVPVVVYPENALTLEPDFQRSVLEDQNDILRTGVVVKCKPMTSAAKSTPASPVKRGMAIDCEIVFYPIAAEVFPYFEGFVTYVNLVTDSEHELVNEANFSDEDQMSDVEMFMRIKDGAASRSFSLEHVAFISNFYDTYLDGIKEGEEEYVVEKTKYLQAKDLYTLQLAEYNDAKLALDDEVSRTAERSDERKELKTKLMELKSQYIKDKQVYTQATHDFNIYKRYHPGYSGNYYDAKERQAQPSDNADDYMLKLTEIFGPVDFITVGASIFATVSNSTNLGTSEFRNCMVRWFAINFIVGKSADEIRRLFDEKDDLNDLSVLPYPPYKGKSLVDQDGELLTGDFYFHNGENVKYIFRKHDSLYFINDMLSGYDPANNWITIDTKKDTYD